jgi:hypothetical protein
MTHDERKDRPRENDPDLQLAAMLEQLSIEKAPVSLRRKLKRIPRQERRSNWQWSWQPPRWALAPAMAAVPLLVIGIVLMQPRQPSQAEIEQARYDLAVAFTYLDKVGDRTGSEIQSVIGGELRHSVTDNLSKHMPFTEQSRKEEST